jgi:CBS domain containing-hemolysin-like protein
VITPEGQPGGLINVLDILVEQNGARPLSDHMRRIVMTSEEEPAYRIVQRLRAARVGLAAVLDEKRNLRGIVTIEDLVRRLVSSTEARA